MHRDPKTARVVRLKKQKFYSFVTNKEDVEMKYNIFLCLKCNTWLAWKAAGVLCPCTRFNRKCSFLFEKWLGKNVIDFWSKSAHWVFQSHSLFFSWAYFNHFLAVSYCTTIKVEVVLPWVLSLSKDNSWCRIWLSLRFWSHLSFFFLIFH